MINIKNYIININNNNIKYTLKHIAIKLNYCRLTNKKIILNHNKINKEFKNELFWLKEIITSFNIKEINTRYSYIYDVMCEYLDNEFITKNHCGFVNNVCVGTKYESKNGCCYGPLGGLCKHMKDNRCSIKFLSCKLFVCSKLKRKEVHYKINKLHLLKLFLNPIQKHKLSLFLRKDKKETIDILLKYRFKLLYY